MNTNMVENMHIVSIKPGSGATCWTVEVAAHVSGVRCTGLYEFKRLGDVDESYFEPDGSVYGHTGFLLEEDADDFLEMSDGVVTVRISTDDFSDATSEVRNFVCETIETLENQLESLTENLIQSLVA